MVVNKYKYLVPWRDIEIENKNKNWIWKCEKCNKFKLNKDVLCGYSVLGSLSEDNPMCEVTGLCADCYDNNCEINECIKIADDISTFDKTLFTLLEKHLFK